MNWYIKVIQKYADFSGRASRTEYWMFTLFNLIFFVAAMILDKILGTGFKIDMSWMGGDVDLGEDYSEYMKLPYGYITLLYYLFIFIPITSVTVRRLHDVGKKEWFVLLALPGIINLILRVLIEIGNISMEVAFSGGYILFGIISLISGIWLLVLMSTDSQQGENQYGANPKGIMTAQQTSHQSYYQQAQPQQQYQPPAQPNFQTVQPLQTQNQNSAAAFCTNCGSKNNAGAKFCFQCGNLLPLPTLAPQTVNQNTSSVIYCTNCGTKSNASSKFCFQCGKEFSV